jgi:hypothetical protein
MKKYLVITDVDHFAKYEIEADQMVVNEDGAVNLYTEDGNENSHKLIASFSPEHLVAVIQLDA